MDESTKLDPSPELESQILAKPIRTYEVAEDGLIPFDWVLRNGDLLN